MNVLFAQETDSLKVDLPEVIIESSRSRDQLNSAGFAVAVREVQEIDRPYSELGLRNIAGQLPGVFISPRFNPSVGDRIIMRGVGWRSAFGVRGIKVVVDGQPLTMPDGQSVLDVIDSSLINRVEVLRGTASSMWGNSSGGVLSLYTGFGEKSRTELSAAGGSFGLKTGSAKIVRIDGDNKILLATSYLDLSGFREYSDTKRARLSALGEFKLSDDLVLRSQSFFLHTPESNNPGSLSQSLLDEDREQAYVRNFETRSGKKFDHLISSLVLKKSLHNASLEAQIFGGIRSLENPLPFAFIDLNRRSVGTRLAYHVDSEASLIKARWSIGIDAQYQSDNRKNFGNNEGVAEEPLRLDQQEKVGYVAGFATTNLRLNNLSLALSSRFDQYSYSADDRLQENGDQSGTRSFSAFNPAANLSLEVTTGHVIYAGISSSFEVPTTTELVNNPTLLGGFNQDLLPQETTSFEGGARGNLITQSSLIEYDIALFDSRGEDGLIPFQVEGGEDRTFFRNGAKSFHRGIEGQVILSSSAGNSISGSFSHGRYEQELSESSSKTNIPGVPANQVNLTFATEAYPILGKVNFRSVSKMYTNSANDAESSAFKLVDIYVAYPFETGRINLRPFAAIENVLNEEYNGSIVINAFGGRFFEPSPPRSFLFGIKISAK